jgi:hypothetical protein
MVSSKKEFETDLNDINFVAAMAGRSVATEALFTLSGSANGKNFSSRNIMHAHIAELG